MQWESWSAFWQMGGAAPFVWGSYGLTVFLVVVELIMVARRRRETVRRLLRLRRASANGRSGRQVFEEIVE
ncbi:MAG: heme exporter protein CcmD [Aromatoleum sp.]|jgi:heme exporter protein D|uniref:heme exporter protein CcmD n=1 Tax=Aromatoleum sp. TaxID=2307007 RepID=UPI002894E924|nr:heme exporter protein CcmD [Aromatoleum sp.]MDT3670067.1 heme exporter protein CcmD [Aromatoleum sp.]